MNQISTKPSAVEALSSTVTLGSGRNVDVRVAWQTKLSEVCRPYPKNNGLGQGLALDARFFPGCQESAYGES